MQILFNNLDTQNSIKKNLISNKALTGKDFSEQGQGGVVGDEARREQQRRLLAVQVGELELEGMVE